MRYELRNRYYGTTVIAPSEQAKDNFIASAKKDPKDNKPVWEVSKELPDAVDVQSREDELLQQIEELKAQIGAENGSTDLSVESDQDVGSSPASSTNSVGSNAEGSTKSRPKKKAK